VPGHEQADPAAGLKADGGYWSRRPERGGPAVALCPERKGLMNYCDISRQRIATYCDMDRDAACDKLVTRLTKEDA